MLGSIRAYARHRKEAGIPGGSHAAVQKAIASGRVKTTAGQVDFDQADRDWHLNSNKHQQRPVKKQTNSGQPPKDASPAPPGESEETGESFLEAQRQHEWLKVQKEELTLKTRRGELMEKAEVEKVWGNLLTTFRNRMLLLPDKVAPRVAAIGEVLECRVIIDREVREALSALSEYQPDVA